MESHEFIAELSPPVFSLLLLTSFTHPQLVSFCARNGLQVPGFRLEKLKVTELIELVYDDCSIPGLPAGSLQEEFDRKFREKIEELEKLSESKIRKIFREDEVGETDEMIGYLWAAWRDRRRRVNREAFRFADFLDSTYFSQPLAEGEEERPSGAPEVKKPGGRSRSGSAGGRRRPDPAAEEVESEELEAGESTALSTADLPFGHPAAQVLSGLYGLEEQWRGEIKKVEKYLKKTAAAAERSRRKAEKRKKEVRERNDQVRLLQDEVKKLKKGVQERDKSRARTPAAPLKEIAELKSLLHGLEREVRKKDHEIAELGRSGDKIRALEEKLRFGEAELAAAHLRNEAGQAERQELEGEIASLKAKIVRLEKSRAAVFTRPRPPRDRERLGIYYDSRNIYYTVRNTFQGGRVDIGEMLTRIVQGRKLVRAMAYVVQADFDNKEPYFDVLAHRGFQVKRRNLKVRQDGSMKGDWDMGIALDLIHQSKDLDTIALVSGDGDFRELAVFLQSRGVRVEVYGVDACTALDLKQVADLFIPIDQAWLYTSSSV